MKDRRAMAAADLSADPGLLEDVCAAIRTLDGSGSAPACVALVEVARTRTGACAAALWLRDRPSGELSMQVPAREPLPRLQPGVGLAGRCAQSAQMLRLDDLSGNRELVDIRLLDSANAASVGAALNVPLGAGREVLGVLQLLHASPCGFGAEAVLVAETVAAQLALVLRGAAHDAAMGAASALHTEVEVAREIQRGTLPTEMPSVPGYDLHGHFQPATYAGGDMLDVVKFSQGVFLLLGDATGHGFGPALSAMQMQGMLRVAFRLGADLDQAYRNVNNQLTEDLSDDRFITAFMGLLDAGAHRVRYQCAGQGPLLHYHAADDRCEWLQPNAFPVGVMELDEVPASASLELAPGDILALISDGLYERLDAGNAEFGPGRVAEVVRSGQHLSMAVLCRRLLAAADDFAAGVAAADDVTLILVRRLPADAAHLPST
jgi:phosphoserine phosphatase